MNDINTLAPVIPGNYSHRNPWRDLRGFISGGWQASVPGGAWPFRARINEDQVDVFAVLQVGTSQNFTTALPDVFLPDRTRQLPAYQIGHGPTVAQITGGGIFRIDPNAGFTPGAGSLIIGYFYPRRLL